MKCLVSTCQRPRGRIPSLLQLLYSQLKHISRTLQSLRCCLLDLGWGHRETLVYLLLTIFWIKNWKLSGDHSQTTLKRILCLMKTKVSLHF